MTITRSRRKVSKSFCLLWIAIGLALLADAGYPNGENWPGLELIYNTSESHRKIAVALQQMWKDVLNIRVTISNQE